MPTHPLTVQALESSLHPGVVEQSWFQDLTALYTKQEKPVPQVIDRIFYDGNNIVVLWIPVSAKAIDKSPQKKGWHISCVQYHLHETGEEIAYAKAIYATEESIASTDENNTAKITSPVVDFSKVSDAFRGQGIAPSMYVYLARKLAEHGMTLRESGCQSDAAAAMWKRMIHDPLLPIFVVNGKHVLDFRLKSGVQEVSTMAHN